MLLIKTGLTLLVVESPFLNIATAVFLADDKAYFNVWMALKFSFFKQFVDSFITFPMRLELHSTTGSFGAIHKKLLSFGFVRVTCSVSSSFFIKLFVDHPRNIDHYWVSKLKDSHNLNYLIDHQQENKSFRAILWHLMVEWQLKNISIYWTLDVSGTASYKITLFRLSGCLSLSFPKIGSLVFVILYLMIADHDI